MAEGGRSCREVRQHHPDFADRVWRAYERRRRNEDRTDEHEREFWKSACGRHSNVDDD